MKTEQQKTDRKLLVGIVLFLLFITIILGTLCFYKHYCNENSNIPEQIAKELEKTPKSIDNALQLYARRSSGTGRMAY